MNADQTKLSLARCPSAEELSIFLDEPADSALAGHISSCAHCQARLSDYAQVDCLLFELSQPPAGLAERIQHACRSEAPAPGTAALPPLFPGSSLLWRYAAVFAFLFALAGLLTWLNLAQGKQRYGKQLAQDSASTQANPPTAVTAQQNAPAEEDFALAEQMRPQGNIDPDSLQNVSTGAGASALKPVNHRRYRIESQIEHVWLVDNLTKSQAMLQELGLQDGFKLKWKQTDNADILHADLRGSDRQLQSLVDRLQAQNWLLLSPAYPQPKAEQSAFFTDSKIIYHATLVQKDAN